MSEGIRNVYDKETPRTLGDILREATQYAVECSQMNCAIAVDQKGKIEALLAEISQLHPKDDATRIELDETRGVLEELIRTQ